MHGYLDMIAEQAPDVVARFRKQIDDDTIILDLAQVDALIADLTAWRAGVDEDRR